MSQYPFPQLMFKNSQVKVPKFTKYIIDTDAGGDDAHGLLIASYLLQTYRKDAELLGITCVAGNASLENVIRNVHIAAQIGHFTTKPKLYKGCRQDTLRRFFRDNFFLEDGLGGGVQEKYLKKLQQHEIPLDQLHEQQHAVDFIVDSIHKYGEDLCIIALGPLTNIYMALQLSPSIAEKLGGLFYMGGTFIGVGNCHNAVSEFNVKTDVEATAAVLLAPFKLIVLVPFDAVLSYEISAEYGKLIFKNHQQTSVSSLVMEMFEKICFEINFYLCDQLVVILGFLPELITYTLEKPVAVVLDGLARGQLIVDWLGKIVKNKEPNHKLIQIVTAVDFERAQKIAHETNEYQSHIQI